MEPQSALTSQTVVVASDSVLSTALGDEAVLLDPEDGLYYSLNEVGARVWTLIQEPASLEALCEKLVREFEVDEETCAADLTELMNDLLARKLVRVQGEIG